MKMALKISFLLVLMVASWDALAEDYLTLEGGPIAYADYEESYPNWNFIEVPIDYSKGDSKKTSKKTWISYKISYKLTGSLAKNNPTVLFINGGPGSNSLGMALEKALPEFAFIYFNQRGVGFSAPVESLKKSEADNYFSTLNTVKDIKMLLGYLGLAKVIVYGHSYGTVVATQFSNLYPEMVAKTILEGVVFTGKESLWNAPHRLKIVQKYFDSLSKEVREKILQYSNVPDVNPSWFSLMAQNTMYSDSFEELMNYRLEALFNPAIADPTPEKLHTTIIERLRGEFPNGVDRYPEDSIHFSGSMFRYISCKELSGDQSGASFEAKFNGEHLEMVPKQSNFCKGISYKQNNIYAATDFPLQGPVVYIQGSKDGATTADQAILHFKQVAKGSATLIIATDAGHLPMLSYLNPYFFELTEITKAHISVFKDIIMDRPIELKPINQFKTKKQKWVMTSKP